MILWLQKRAAAQKPQSEPRSGIEILARREGCESSVMWLAVMYVLDVGLGLGRGNAPALPPVGGKFFDSKSLPAQLREKLSLGEYIDTCF
jgi:hypothetical protein